MSRATVLATIFCLALPIGQARAAWPPLGGEGLTVCDLPGKPYFPSSAPDGSGGAYLAWVDSRESPLLRVFVQHLSGAGTALWPANGVSLGPVPVANEWIATASDGQGGVIVVWRDFRADTAGNLYANRLNASGTLLWGPTGVPVILGARHEVFFVAAADGNGGAFVAWRDDRDTLFTIRAQRLDAGGNLVWPADGIVLAPNGLTQHSPRIAADATGGVLVGWTEVQGNHYQGVAQRLSGTGNTQWATVGVNLSTSTLGFGVILEDLAADGTGGALAALGDYRSQNTWRQAFAQRVDAGGNIAWVADGVSLSGTSYPVEKVTITSDQQGGAIVAWHNYNGDNFILAQRISPTGTKLWPLPGIEVVHAYGEWMRMNMFPDGAGGAIFGWNGSTPPNGPAYSVYAQRLNPLGSLLWAQGGVVLAAFPNVVLQLEMVSDGAGGAVAGWIDSEGFVDNDYSLHAERVGPDGTLDVPDVLLAPVALRCVPTPARASTGVELRFPQTPGSDVRVQIFDVGGRLVRSLDHGARTPAGVRWDGRDAAGALCAPGLYLASVQVGPVTSRARLVLID